VQRRTITAKATTKARPLRTRRVLFTCALGDDRTGWTACKRLSRSSAHCSCKTISTPFSRPASPADRLGREPRPSGPSGGHAPAALDRRQADAERPRRVRDRQLVALNEQETLPLAVTQRGGCPQEPGSEPDRIDTGFSTSNLVLGEPCEAAQASLGGVSDESVLGIVLLSRSSAGSVTCARDRTRRPGAPG
jgi:hypothetical protein